MYQVTEIALPADGAAVLQSIIAEAPAAEPSSGIGGMFRRMVGSEGPSASDEAAAAQALLKAGRCEQVVIRHDTPPALIRYDGGVLAFVGISPTETMMLDLAEGDEDPRWAMLLDGRLMQRDWRWLRLGDLGSDCFMTDGPAITPTDLGKVEGTELDKLLSGDFKEAMDESILEMPLAEIIGLAQKKTA